MRKTVAGLFAMTLVAGATAVAAPATASSPPLGPGSDPVMQVVDELANPLEDKRRALRDEAVTQVLDGEATPTRSGGSTVVELADGGEAARPDGGVNARSLKAPRTAKYVEVSRETTDKIFVLLTEFGDERDPAYLDQDTAPAIPGPQAFDGPLHNAIPEPVRSVDNSTIWQPDYDREHYQNLYFGTGDGVESLKTYYETQSSGRYSVDGTVSDWVKVPYNEARYGRSDGFPCADNVCDNTWDLLRDGLDQWVADQEAAGQTPEQIKAQLSEYDIWDRYDYDGDGDFNESDGYIDHFQVVHSGGDQADGDPYQGEDAIWSHRWRAYQGGEEGDGPADFPIGGVEIGDTGLWVADYTIQPENGGLSVFAHEYGHDLGLPDDYDTAGGASNNNEYWTLMSQSRLNGEGESIGTRPGDLGAWQKLQLGWLDYEVVLAGQARTLQLGPEEYNSKRAQAAVVVLPQKEVTTELTAPFAGEYEWWSGQGDSLDNNLIRTVTLPAGESSLRFQASWNIEDCGPTTACDYAYVEVDDGTGWAAVPGSITKPGEGNGIDGLSGWVPATFDLTAFAGKTIEVRFRYLTDGAAQGQDPAAASGLFIDEIELTAGDTALFGDGAETLDAGWTADGFVRTTGTETELYDNYYIAGNRSYVGYDRYLRTGPYNFGDPTRPDLAQHFPYQQGLLISYWDTSQADNNVSVHPGEGRNLYVDAHPEPLYNLAGAPWRNRIQLYDAPFSLKRADSFTLAINGRPSYLRGQAAQPVFDDTRDYRGLEALGQGVELPGAGVRIAVTKQNGTQMTIRLLGKAPRR